MLDFIRDNIGTIIVGIILALIVALVITKIVKDRKKGKRACGCGCSGCPAAGMCHSESDKTTK